MSSSSIPSSAKHSQTKSPASLSAADTVTPSSPSQQDVKPRNAFSALRSPSSKSTKDSNTKSKPHTSPRHQTHLLPKRKRSPPPTTPLTDPSRATTNFGREGLGPYIKSPESFPPSRIVYHNDKFVVIHDLFPKASVHLLILPRDPDKWFLHPFEAFEDEAFLRDVIAEAEELKELAAGELNRRFGALSQSRKQVSGEESEEKSKGEDNAKEQTQPNQEQPSKGHQTLESTRNYSTNDLLCGIHAHPSMSHLHIHILSIDRYSPCLRHRKHYNSFSTPFFVPLDAFPLDRHDPRRHPGREGYLDRDLSCWRCGKNFGKSFKALKEHLEVEFEAWKRESSEL